MQITIYTRTGHKRRFVVLFKNVSRHAQSPSGPGLPQKLSLRFSRQQHRSAKMSPERLEKTLCSPGVRRGRGRLERRVRFAFPSTFPMRICVVNLFLAVTAIWLSCCFYSRAWAAVVEGGRGALGIGCVRFYVSRSAMTHWFALEQSSRIQYLESSTYLLFAEEGQDAMSLM